MPGCVRTPGRSCGSKTPPRSRHRATGTPSWPDQRGGHHGSHVHTAHRNGPNPTAARYQAGRRPGRLQAVCPQGCATPDGSTGAPRDETFCHRDRSSSRSKPLGETRMEYWKRYYRLTSHTRQLHIDKPDGLFRGQPPRRKDAQAMAAEGVKRWRIDCKATGKIGEFSRGGRTRGDNRASDHGRGCKEKYVPCGIVDEERGDLAL